MSRVLVTGASGFVGQAVCSSLLSRGVTVLAAARSELQPAPGQGTVRLSEMSGSTDWSKVLDGVEGIIHLAARVHVMKETAADPWREFLISNVEATRRLAEQAAEAGVRRLVFISSVKVNGEQTAPGHPFTTEDEPAPGDAYGASKLLAEEALADVAARTGLEVVGIRPPLVYGPGVKGNFLTLLKACRRRLPLPLGGIDNRRSLVYLGNLVDALLRALDHPAAPGNTYLVRDGEDLSTPQLVRRLSAALGVQPRLLPAPLGLMRAAAGVIGRRGAVERLTSSLQVDDSALREDLGWAPPFTVDQGLALTARWAVGQSR